jgi:hypothetical protein
MDLGGYRLGMLCGFVAKRKINRHWTSSLLLDSLLQYLLYCYSLVNIIRDRMVRLVEYDRTNPLFVLTAAKSVYEDDALSLSLSLNVVSSLPGHSIPWNRAIVVRESMWQAKDDRRHVQWAFPSPVQ